MGMMNELEWNLYTEYYDWLYTQFKARVLQGIIYLQVDPKVCFTRLQKRSREEEKSTVSLDYLEKLNARHDEWLIAKRENNNFKLLIVDGNCEFEENPNRQLEIISQINNFL